MADADGAVLVVDDDADMREMVHDLVKDRGHHVSTAANGPEALKRLGAEGFEARVPEERMGTKPENLSPAHQVTKNGPPTIIFHGRADTTVPYASAEAFNAKMRAQGNRCELHGYDDQKHGFFNGDEYKEKTLAATDAFLALVLVNAVMEL